MKLLRLGSLFATAVVLTACTRTVIREGSAPPIHIATPDTGVRLNNASITDASIANKVAIEASGWQRTDTGTAQVWVQIRNRTDYFMQLEARTQFFDTQKAPLGNPSAWQRITMSPNTIQTYRENSVHTTVGYYYVEIREGR